MTYSASYRYGIGWRSHYSASIFANLDALDLVEVIVDDYFLKPKKYWHELRTLAAQVPVVLHGVSLGLASVHPVDETRLNKLAELLDYVRPVFWSEHLAFVRAGNIEIGHLTAPPRNAATVAGTVKNLRRIEQVTGSRPHLENIATLITPPGSSMQEGQWCAAILEQSGCNMLLDLHNLYANALNSGAAPDEYLCRFPLERTRSVHLSGGKWIPKKTQMNPTSDYTGVRQFKLLDDHLHDVPEDVFALLGTLVQKVPHGLDILIERDGKFPDFCEVLSQLERARGVVHAAQNQLEMAGSPPFSQTIRSYHERRSL